MKHQWFVDKEDFCHLTLKVQVHGLTFPSFHIIKKVRLSCNEIHKTTNTVEEHNINANYVNSIWIV